MQGLRLHGKVRSCYTLYSTYEPWGNRLEFPRNRRFSSAKFNRISVSAYSAKRNIVNNNLFKRFGQLPLRPGYSVILHMSHVLSLTLRFRRWNGIFKNILYSTLLFLPMCWRMQGLNLCVLGVPPFLLYYRISDFWCDSNNHSILEHGNNTVAVLFSFKRDADPSDEFLYFTRKVDLFGTL